MNGEGRRMTCRPWWLPRAVGKAGQGWHWEMGIWRLTAASLRMYVC
jgi:hypothetical protein